jgi:DNA-binding NarL/FixJ family response regulator
MKKPDAIRVLIADDHAIVREGLAVLVNRCEDMMVVAQATNGKEAIERVLRYKPDVVLMDLRMPELGGVAAIEAIRESLPEVRIVVLTVFDGDEDIYRSMRAGAKAYLLKDAAPKDLLDCVRAVHSGKTSMPPGIAEKLASRVSARDLTRREGEILALMVQGKTNKEIGQALDITEGTVKIHVTHLLAKLGVEGRAGAIGVALQRGIIRPQLE